MTFRFIEMELDGTFPIRVCCRVLGVSVSGYYGYKGRPLSATAVANEVLLVQIRAAREASFGTYGARRVHAELRLGMGLSASPNRVERLMRVHGIQGVHYRRRRGCTRRNPADVPAGDLVERDFHPDGPDRLWVADITEHPTGEGKVYVAAVVDAWSRRVVGWSIADHLRSELVVDALEMAVWRRRPVPAQTVHHSDHAAQGGLQRGCR